MQEYGRRYCVPITWLRSHGFFERELEAPGEQGLLFSKRNRVIYDLPVV